MRLASLSAVPFNSDLHGAMFGRPVTTNSETSQQGLKGPSATTKNASEAGNPQLKIVASHLSGEGIGGQTDVA
jgi:hypothetical protein